jgi:hypothetical protein
MAADYSPKNASAADFFRVGMYGATSSLFRCDIGSPDPAIGRVSVICGSGTVARRALGGSERVEELPAKSAAHALTRSASCRCKESSRISAVSDVIYYEPPTTVC